MVPSNQTLLTILTILFFNHITCTHFYTNSIPGFEIDVDIGPTITTVTAYLSTSHQTAWHGLCFGSLQMNNSIALIQDLDLIYMVPTFSIRRLGDHNKGTVLDPTGSNWNLLSFDANSNPIVITLTRNNDVGLPYYEFDPIQTTLNIIYAYGIDFFPTEFNSSVGHGGGQPGAWEDSYYYETLPQITDSPTKTPSINPSKTPTLFPTKIPSISPTNIPSTTPTLYPTNIPSITPTKDPTMEPTMTPSKTPSRSPTTPTLNPTYGPTGGPTSDTVDPTNAPTQPPTNAPSHAPTHPTYDPTRMPTNEPTQDPTNDPTSDPTYDPTNDPTTDPTNDPTSDPTTDPTNDPTTDPTYDPTADPTTDPTYDPTTNPTRDPTNDPTTNPTKNPSTDPTWNPTNNPTVPTLDPSTAPTFSPSVAPSNAPTTPPSNAPTSPPSLAPSYAPTYCKSAKFADKVFFGDYLWSDKNESVVSNDCNCRLIMNDKGNLIMLEDGKRKWESDTEIDDYTGEMAARFGLNEDGVLYIKQYAYRGIPSVALKAITLWTSGNDAIGNVNDLIVYITNLCCLDLVQEKEDERAKVIWSSCDEISSTTDVITTDSTMDEDVTVDAGGSTSGQNGQGEIAWWIWLIIAVLVLLLMVVTIVVYKRYNDNVNLNKTFITSSVGGTGGGGDEGYGMHGMYGDSGTVDDNDCLETDKQIDQWMTGTTNVDEDVGETEKGNVEIMYDKGNENNSYENENENENENKSDSSDNEYDNKNDDYDNENENDSAAYQNSIELQPNIGDSDSD